MLNLKSALPVVMVTLMLLGSGGAMSDETEGKLIYTFEEEDQFDERHGHGRRLQRHLQAGR